MALVLEDGTGVAGADTWVDEPDATAYWTARDQEKWVAATIVKRAAALRNAADYLMLCYRWPGQPTTLVQRLPWPRSGVRSGIGWYPSDAIPSQVIDAQMVLAVEALDRDLLQRPVNDRQIIEETKAVKGISKTVKYQAAPIDSVSGLVRFPVIDAMLHGVAIGGSGNGFGVVKLVKGI